MSLLSTSCGRVIAACIVALGAACAADAGPRTLQRRPGETTLVGAGDIATCANDDDERTARLVERVLADDPRAFAFTLGDNVYDSGTPEEFSRCYAPTWGRFVSRTLPVVGNHDYRTSQAAGFRAQFGERFGRDAPFWYSVDVPVGQGTTAGSWHVIVLDSNCDEIDCSVDGAQHRWLLDDLRKNTATCTLALWHHPRFSSGPHGDSTRMAPAWQALQDAGAELVLAGHDHMYETFAPLRADGTADPTGLRSMVVGTGGRSHYPVGTAHAASTVRIANVSGVLTLYLAPTGWRFAFVDVDGVVRDAGTGRCH